MRSTAKRSTARNGRRPEQGPRPSRRSPRGWSSMNPFDAMQNLADLWNQGGQAYLTAQQGLFTGMADTMAKAAGRGDTASFQAFAPDTQGFEAARQDFPKLWSSAGAEGFHILIGGNYHGHLG